MFCFFFLVKDDELWQKMFEGWYPLPKAEVVRVPDEVFQFWDLSAEKSCTKAVLILSNNIPHVDT
jgi:hypothetical protein